MYTCKAIFKPFLFLGLILFLFSCKTDPPANEGSTSKTTSSPQQQEAPFADEFGPDKKTEEPNPVNNSGYNYKALCKEICDCSQKSIEHNEAMQKLQETGDSKAFLKMLNVAPKYFNEAVKCAIRAKDQMSKTPIDGQQFNSNLSRQCNNMPKRMREQLFQKLSKASTK